MPRELKQTGQLSAKTMTEKPHGAHENLALPAGIIRNCILATELQCWQQIPYQANKTKAAPACRTPNTPQQNDARIRHPFQQRYPCGPGFGMQPTLTQVPPRPCTQRRTGLQEIYESAQISTLQVEYEKRVSILALHYFQGILPDDAILNNSHMTPTSALQNLWKGGASEIRTHVVPAGDGLTKSATATSKAVWASAEDKFRFRPAVHCAKFNDPRRFYDRIILWQVYKRGR